MSLIAAALLTCLPAPAALQTPVRARLIAEGFTTPTCVRPFPGLDETYVVTEQAGLIRTVVDGELLPQPLLDLTAVTTVSGLGGLVSLEFDPDFETTRHVFVYYANSVAPMGSAVLQRYTVPAGTLVADPASAVDLLTVTDVIAYHNGSGMFFGTDGKLYLGIGDRRLELDGTNCVAQDGQVLLGKLLRLEKDGSPAAGNPYIGNPNVRDEVYAMGLRQPFRMTQDAVTGDIWFGDVGESDWEEINFIRGNSPGGLNFGWRLFEGPVSGAVTTLCTALNPEAPNHTLPLYDYTHANGCSVTGGRVYRGTEIPELGGRYLFADWCSQRYNVITSSSPGTFGSIEELTQRLQPPGPLTLGGPTDFGYTHDGEIVIADSGFGVPGAGRLWRMVRDRPLDVDRETVSLSAGGTQHLEFDAGADKAGAPFWVIGSLSGTSPGTVFGGLPVPLNPDNYTNLTLAGGGGILNPGVGTVPTDGNALSEVVIPAGLTTALLGKSAHHVCVLVDIGPGGAQLRISNPVELSFLP